MTKDIASVICDGRIAEDAKQKIAQFLEMVAKKNEVMNLTAIDDPAEMWVKHVEDSLTILPLLQELQPKTVLDIGTGAGFPGVVASVAYDTADYTLLDSLNKRIVFIEESLAELGIKNAKALHARAEDFAKTDARESFDVVVSRAVASMNTLAELTLPFAKVGGHIIAMKGPACADELAEAENAIHVLGGDVLRVEQVHLSDGSERNLVLIRKNRQTAKKYPRGQNKPKKNPL